MPVTGRFDDHQVDVAVPGHLASRGGTEQNDPVGLRDGEDAGDNFGQQCVNRRPSFSMVPASGIPVIQFRKYRQGEGDRRARVPAVLEDAGFTTGTDIPIDGGRTAM